MPVPCARCQTPLPSYGTGATRQVDCPACGAFNTAEIFPAAFAPKLVSPSEHALAGEAACYDHPTHLAVASCRHCGRFVCQLCAVDFGPEIWCPSCVASGAGKPAEVRDNARTLYDSIALLAPTVSLLIWPFTFLAAPAALVFSVLKWNKPISLVRRSRWRFVAAMAVSLAEIGGWCWVLIFLATRAARRAG
jgi:hypothetical protein